LNVADEVQDKKWAAKIGAKMRALLTRATTAEAKVTELTTANATLTGKVTDLEKQVLNPDAKDKKIAELQGSIRTGKHKARFAELAKEAGAPDSAIADLYELSKHKAETDEPDDEVLKGLVETAKTERAYVFTSSTTTTDTKPAPKVPPGQGRGGANNGGDGTIITAEQRADPKFMLNPANREVIQAAAKEGRFR
jgi:hypothetical protein